MTPSEVRSRDRHLFGQTPTLGILLASPHVFVHSIDAFDDDLTGLGIHRQHLASLAGVVTADNHYHIVDLDPHHSTSLAKLTIFMKLRSRNSRATAPKMRVPRGFRSLSMMTTALLSKRM